MLVFDLKLFTNINFKKIKKTDFIGKVVVLNFWGPFFI